MKPDTPVKAHTVPACLADRLPVPHRMSADLDDLGAPLHTANPDPQRADSAIWDDAETLSNHVA